MVFCLFVIVCLFVFVILVLVFKDNPPRQDLLGRVEKLQKAPYE